MKNKINLNEEIIQFLLEQPMAKKSISGKEMSTRCPFCGDSMKSRYSTNFYINIDEESDKFLCYKCFRASCNVSGVIDQYLLERIGFSDFEKIRKFNKYMAKKSKSIKNVVKYNGRYRKELSNVIDTNNLISEKKLAYINRRMGLSLTYEDLYNLKINLDMNNLLKINEINVDKSKKKYYDALSAYGICFISAYNDYLIIRDVSKDGRLNRRYTNINIFDNYDNVTKSYSIPRKIDLLSNEPTVLNITEGAFDIIGVYYNLDIDREYKNQLFLAASGAGIFNVIMHYVKQYGLLNLKINIFSDSDVPLENYKNLYRLKKYLYKFDVTIYYNTLSKDFGVDKNSIDIIKSKL